MLKSSVDRWRVPTRDDGPLFDLMRAQDRLDEARQKVRDLARDLELARQDVARLDREYDEKLTAVMTGKKS